jgi:hydrogenase maturation protease
MAETCGRIRVIGVGNEFREDDAAGIVALRRLRDVVRGDVEFLERSGEGAELMAAWEGAEAVLLCDAVASSEAAGTVLRFESEASPLPAELRPCSSHAFGVGEAIELARTLGSLPRKLVIYGIVGKRFGAGVGLSVEAEAGVEEAVRRMAEEVAVMQGSSHHRGAEDAEDRREELRKNL